MSDATKTKPKTKQPSSIYVNDPDAKKFYEMRGQSVRNLREGDLIYCEERLCQVKSIDRRGNVTLDNGRSFNGNPTDEPGDAWKLSVTFWRPRPGF